MSMEQDLLAKGNPKGRRFSLARRIKIYTHMCLVLVRIDKHTGG